MTSKTAYELFPTIWRCQQNHHGLQQKCFPALYFVRSNQSDSLFVKVTDVCILPTIFPILLEIFSRIQTDKLDIDRQMTDRQIDRQILRNWLTQLWGLANIKSVGYTSRLETQIKFGAVLRQNFFLLGRPQLLLFRLSTDWMRTTHIIKTDLFKIHLLYTC